MTASLDLNVSPHPLFDLNEYPQENHDGEETTLHSTQDDGWVLRDLDLNLPLQPGIEDKQSIDGRVVRDFDLNLAPDQEAYNAQSIEGASSARGHVVRYVVRRELPIEKRRHLVEVLVWRCTSKGRLTKEIVDEVATSFSVSARTVRRIWQRARQCFRKGAAVDFSTKKSHCGRKRALVDLSSMRNIPLSERTTLADLSKHLHVSTSTLCRYKKQGLIRKHSNTIKPHLTEQNMKERLRWCISMLDPRSIHIEPIFKDFSDFVFIDEKWFFLTRKTGIYYLVPGEEEPYRTCKNKNFIRKVMFLFALGRPRMNDEGICTFDGKIGCFPLITYEPAKRTSKNRVAGTLEMKPIMSVNKEVMRSVIIEKVLPAIREKWPREDAGKPIYIQQDNARPHIDPSDPLFCEAAQQDGFNIQLICQPPNSPDLNILDLGFFASIQSLQFKNDSRTIADIVAVVQQEFEKYSPTTSNRIFVTLQTTMIEVMKMRGGNNYKPPHINKPSLEREGKLPWQMKCDLSLVQEVCMQIEQ